MARVVDVYVSPGELGDFNKQPTSLVKLDDDLMKPTVCASKQGKSGNTLSACLFGATGANPRPPSSLTVGDYARLFEKYYGVDAAMEALAPQPARQRPRASSTSRIPFDRTRSLHSSSPDPYAEEHDGLTDPYAEEGDVGQAMKQQASSLIKARNLPPHLARKYGMHEAHIVKAAAPPPSSFGISVVPGGSMPPEVAQGAAAAAAAAAAAHNTSSAKATEATAVVANALRDLSRQRAQRSAEAGLAAAAARSRAAAAPARPGSAPFLNVSREQVSARTAPGRGVPGPGKYTASYSLMDRTIPAAYLMRHHTSAARSPEATGIRPDTQRSTSQVSPDPAAEDVGPSPSTTAAGAAAPAAGGTTTKTEGRKSPEFPDAHHVHERRPASAGTAAFKAPPRPTPSAASTASHLYGTYFQEGYDKSLQRVRSCHARFDVQTLRPAPGVMCETSPALGPGSYHSREALPATRTGRHVSAGHKSINAPRFGKQRAASAKALSAKERRANLGVQQALWGLENMDYPDLMSLQLLQSQMRGLPPKGAAIINVHATQHMYSPRTSEDGDWHARTVPHDGPGPYLGHDNLAKFSSSGMEKRVLGGTMSTLTRPGQTISMRAYCDGRIIPPAACPQHIMGAENTYHPDDSVQAHRPRSPGWQLPPNRAAMAQQRMAPAAAVGYV